MTIGPGVQEALIGAIFLAIFGLVNKLIQHGREIAGLLKWQEAQNGSLKEIKDSLKELNSKLDRALEQRRS